jgi:4-hydroxybenzoate polyprenyltransferase
VFAALLFARQAGQPAQGLRALVVFGAFCLASSAVYVLNDVVDMEADRRHPRKRLRPIAAGALSRESGIVLAPLLATAALVVGRQAEPPALACLLGFLAISAAYSFRLKRIVIVDVLAVAAGFVLRAAAGAYAIAVEISPWLLMCAMLLALFLAVAKRRHELVEIPAARTARPVLGQYTAAMLDQMIAVLTSCTLMAYILYAFSEQTAAKFPSHLMPLTTVFVVFGVFRYLFLIYQRSGGGEPEVLLLTDRPLLASLIGYVLAVLLIIR